MRTCVHYWEGTLPEWTSVQILDYESVCKKVPLYGIKTDLLLLDPIYDWCRKSIECHWTWYLEIKYKHTLNVVGQVAIFQFEDKRSAEMFRLAWG